MKNIYLKLRSVLAVAVFAGATMPANLNSQTTYSFFTCGATGRFGPSQNQVNNTYTNTNLQGSVTVIGNGIQTWTVPVSGAYRILSIGAQGGTESNNKYGGRGASMSGDFNLTAGQVLKILVGQVGGATLTYYGGGGGSFVSTNANVPLCVAGGGGGAGGTGGGNGVDATLTTTGTPGTAGGTGGVNGSGGGAVSTNGGSGGGFYTDGTTTGIAAACGTAFINGGDGGVYAPNLPGGFGGGGSGWWTTGNGGGGGGYSGGGTSGASYTGGGGGGSYNIGSNQTNIAGTGTGDGKVVITSLCNISLVSTSNPICSGNSATLSTNAASNYSWNTGSTASAIAVSPTVTTSYTVTGTSTANCSTSAVITITVIPGVPVLSVVNSSPTICLGRSATLTANGAVTYTWTGGITNGVSFSPTVNTTYTVTGTNICGASSTTAAIVVNPNPTISITASTASLCSGNTATIIVGGVPTSTISNGVQNGVSFMPQITTVYTATGTSALGCTAIAQTTITVVQTPTAFPGAAPALICIGGTSTISASGAQGYTWSTGSNQPSFTDSPTITTVYTVTKTNGPCQDIKSVTLTVAPLPFILALTNPTVVCSLKQVTLNAGGAQTYTWAPFGGIGNGLVVTPTVTTIFTVTGNDGTCSNTGTVLLTVLPNPTISIAATSTVLCLGECATLTLGGASTYTWYTAGLTGTNVNQCPTGTTSYSVAGTNSVGCTTGSTKVLVVNPVPNVNVFTNKPMVCSGQGSTLTVNGANTYTWSTGPLGTVSVVNPQTTSVYTVTGFLNGTGCNTTKTIQVTVFSPTFQVPSTASSCIGGTVNLCASGADSYTWNGNFSFPCISVSPSVYTIYQVSATSTSLNINNSPVSCISSNTVGVSIYLNPTITIAASRTTICKGESTNLTGIGGTTFTWSTFQQGTTVPVSPFVQTTYTVLGADANGCQGTAAIQIKVGQCTGLDELSSGVTQFIVFPNPNTGEFTIKSDQALQLQLVNEIGQVIFTIDLKPENGHSKTITDLPNGVYFITGESNNSGMNRKVIVNR